MSIKLPYLGPTGKAALIAAWTRNELEKRQAWLSPTYTQWNPKLPWGTDYETLTEQPPGIPSDSTNARLEPWRRWNWITDGTPNKWLNVPYEYPWNMAAGQYSSFYNLLWSPDNENPEQNSAYSGIVPIPAATMDLAIWNPNSYVGRPAVSESVSTTTGEDTETSYTFKEILPEHYEVIVMRQVRCCNNRGPGGVEICTYYQIPEVRTRVKGGVYDENENVTWPKVVNPRTGEEEEVSGTVYSWGQEVNVNTSWKYNRFSKSVFLDNRITPAVCRWNLKKETYRQDSRYNEKRWYEEAEYFVRARYDYWCDFDTRQLNKRMREGLGITYYTFSYVRPRGMLEVFTVDYTDTFKFSSYQKKTPYPCYRKQPRPADRRYWDYRRFNRSDVEGAEPISFWVHNYADIKPESYGEGNTRLEVDGYDDAPNTWYARYRYKPSQHWADGWGIRNESANFYYEPEYRIGKVFKSATEVDEAGVEKDPITQNYNGYFWQGMHKELYPMFTPGTYVGTAPKTDEGLPRTPNVPPNEEEEVYEYQQRTSSYIQDYYSNYIHGGWFTMPVNHYSANDLWKTLCRQNNVAWRDDRPDEVVAALRAINIPGQPDVLEPPYPSFTLLDTTFIFNQNTLVPTDFVHASMTPLPVMVTGVDANFQAIKTPAEPAVKLNLEPIFADSGDLEDMRWNVDAEITFEKLDGQPPVPPIRNLKVTPLPTVRPPFATLANYPTGWEIHPDHYKTHQARLIGETEMNHRCESTPNWLDSDGGLLYYFTEGITTNDTVYLKKTTYFYFLRQARLPSYHDTHQGISLKVELLFRKKTRKVVYNAAARSHDIEILYDVERYEVSLKWPDDQNLDPVFDSTYYPKDTDPGRQEANPSKTPSKWWGPSTLPNYDIYKVTNSGDSTKSGVVEDKRDWQAHGPYMQTVVSIVTYNETYDTSGHVPVVVMSRNRIRNIYVPNPNPGNEYQPSDPAKWGSWTNEVYVDQATELGPIKWTTISLELIDVKITDIFGPVYRSYGSNAPAGSDPT